MNGDIPGKVERGRTEEDLVTIESYSVVKEGCATCHIYFRCPIFADLRVLILFVFDLF